MYRFLSALATCQWWKVSPSKPECNQSAKVSTTSFGIFTQLLMYPRKKKKVLRHSVSCCPSCALTSGLFRIIYSSVSHISCRWFGAEFPNILSNSSLLEISKTSAQVQTRKGILKAKPILEEFLLSQLHTASNISAQLINAVKPAVFHITIEQEHNWSFLLEVRHIQSPIC